MTTLEIYNQFVHDVKITRWEEWVSTCTQIASVYFARKNNILVYPTGIIGVILAAWVYFNVASPPLYADGILNIYYFLMSLYGWYTWSRVKDNDQTLFNISWCSAFEIKTGIAGFLGSWGLIFIMLRFFTESNTPIADAMVSSSALTAMWWMARRKIENWQAWMISNLVAIPLNFYKGFMLFTFMYILFLYMAYQGYREWKFKMN